MRLHHLIALASAALWLSCGGSDPYGSGTSPSCTPTATRVCMTASTFDPMTLTVSEGAMVTWQNGTSLVHTVTSNPGSTEVFDQTVGGSGSFSYAFNSAGTYEYHCKLHGTATSGMRGTIVVE